MTAWTRDIALCTDGASALSQTAKSHLRRNNIQLVEERSSALFFDMPSSGQSRLAESLGCQFSRHGGIKCGQYEATSVPGVFVAGNIIKDVQLAIVAAAEGTRAAFGINRALTREDFARKATGSRRIEHPTLDDAAMQRRRPTHA